MSSERPQAPTGLLKRLAAVDLMRGIVMMLTAVDHSSDAFNAGVYLRTAHATNGSISGRPA